MAFTAGHTATASETPAKSACPEAPASSEPPALPVRLQSPGRDLYAETSRPVVSSPSPVRRMQELGWQPTQPGLLDDLDRGHYFDRASTRSFSVLKFLRYPPSRLLLRSWERGSIIV